MEELDITKDGKDTKIRVNIDKKEKYLEDEATAIDILFRSLSDEDQALIDEYETAFQFWAYLREKYSQTDATTANIYMTKIQTFTFNPENKIVGSWETLKDYRRKLVAADALFNEAFQDSALLLVLCRSLPESFTTTIDTFNAQLNLTVKQKLKFLEEKEIRTQQRLTNRLTQRFERPTSMFHPKNAKATGPRCHHQTLSIVLGQDLNVAFVTKVISCGNVQTLRRLESFSRSTKLGQRRGKQRPP
jgi:hypothetical protein